MKSISEQPEAIARALSVGLNADAFHDAFHRRSIHKVWVLGSGTSYFAAQIAARAWEAELGIDCQASSALEFLDRMAQLQLNEHVLVLAISQSGAALTLQSVFRQVREAGALTAIVTAFPGAATSSEAEFVVETHTGVEQNMGKTKGFTTSTLVAVMLGRRLALPLGTEGDASLWERHKYIPALLNETIGTCLGVVDQWVDKFRDVQAVLVVGAGAQVAAASEGALKLLEVAKLPVWSLELEEAMHGPVNALGPSTGVVLVADSVPIPERLSGYVNAIDYVGVPFLKFATSAAITEGLGRFDLVLPACEDVAVRTIRSVVPFQILAHALSAARGMPIDTARYPELYKILSYKSFHKELP